MPSRRAVLQAGARTALTLPAARLGAAGLGSHPSGLLAPQNTPVPYAGIFLRPPELTPFEVGFDAGDPTRPYARYAVTAQLCRVS